MKNAIIYLILVFPQFVTAQVSEKGIQFDVKSSWGEVKQKAAEENKMIFIDVYTTWCGPCKKMEKEVYTNDTVAQYFNQNFISVKIQFDSTKNDSKNVRMWRPIAIEFANKYEIEGFPTFLFFNSNGEIINKGLGYHTTSQLIWTAKESKGLSGLNNELKRYLSGFVDSIHFKELAVYANKIGNKKLSKKLADLYLVNIDKSSPSKELIEFTRNIAKNYRLADSLSLIYKRTVFDTLSDRSLLQAEILNFAYYYLLKFCTPSDKLFQISYNNPTKINSVALNEPWLAQNIVYSVIYKTITESLKANAGPPDWDTLLLMLKDRFPKVNGDSIISDYKVGYYYQKKDWSNYTSSIIKRVKKYGEFGMDGGENADLNFNNLAWELFQHSNDASELQIALQWSDKAVNLQKKTLKRIDLGNFMDTKANILYKLGHKKNAIRLEEEALALNPPEAKTIQQNLNKMRKGVRTW
jgi:thioredoxin-related protein